MSDSIRVANIGIKVLGNNFLAASDVDLAAEAEPNLFDETVRGVGLPRMAWKPYSLRRGGATDDFGHHANFDRTTERGRWQSSRTARIYINEAVAEVGTIVTTPKQLRLQEQYQKYVPFA